MSVSGDENEFQIITIVNQILDGQGPIENSPLHPLGSTSFTILNLLEPISS